MKYSILIIDDDQAIHVVLKSVLSNDFDLIHAKDAQEGINMIAEQKVDMIISDIHMPGMDGMSFLESLTKDADRKSIPFLIMTSLPTVEKEQMAFDLGAVDFVDKGKMKKEEILDLVNMKLVSHIQPDQHDEPHNINLKLINQKMMFAAASNDFFDTARTLYLEIKHQFGLEHVSVWMVRAATPTLTLNLGLELPDGYASEQMKEEEVFHNTLKSRSAYFNNNILHSDLGAFLDYSREHDLVAEIGAPLFALTDKQLVQLKMRVPKTAPIFGFVVLKRKKLFSTREYKLLSMLITRTGSILYRLYTEI